MRVGISGCGSQVWANCERQTKKVLVNISASKFFSDSCLIYLINYLGSSTKVSTFAGVETTFFERLKIYLAGDWKFFQKNMHGDAYSGPMSS